MCSHLSCVSAAGRHRQSLFRMDRPYKESEPHYYTLNTTFLIEFDNRGLGNSNHIHCILREKRNEFVEDVLKKHYQMGKH